MIIFNKPKSVFICLLLSSVALPVPPANADAELDALQARFEKAQKENLKLKAEKLEKENLTMKAESLEQENSRLKAESSTVKPVAPIASNIEPINSGKQQSLATSYKTSNSPAGAQYEQARANQLVNKALENIPKNDPRREMTAAAHVVPVSTVSPVVQQWGGVYAGINAGYGKASYLSSTKNYSVNSVGYGETTTNADGPVVGGLVGYNHQFSNNVILGAEVDMDYADIRASGSPNDKNFGASSNSGSYYFTNYFNASGRTGLDWNGTARARAGYSLGNFMPYVTAGLAYGNISTSTDINSLYAQGNSTQSWVSNSNLSSSFGNVQFGWAAGAGAELKVADHWSVKGEYLYTSIGGLTSTGMMVSENSTTYNGITAQGNSASVYNNSMGSFGIHQARIGLNYYTGWGTSLQRAQ